MLSTIHSIRFSTDPTTTPCSSQYRSSASSLSVTSPARSISFNAVLGMRAFAIVGPPPLPLPRDGPGTYLGCSSVGSTTAGGTFTSSSPSPSLGLSASSSSSSGTSSSSSSSSSTTSVSGTASSISLILSTSSALNTSFPRIVDDCGLFVLRSSSTLASSPTSSPHGPRCNPSPGRLAIHSSIVGPPLRRFRERSASRHISGGGSPLRRLAGCAEADSEGARDASAAAQNSSADEVGVLEVSML
ncbi:hypothetical protein DFP73DRAFT_541759 [Morchella snyderi]|nr:hypothetical protein DFP73DRAFT_541759 [Morchella snyderi]